MSTILEALRKSEQERRLNDVPTLADMPTPQETKKWPMVLIAMLVALLIVLLLVLSLKWWSAQPSSEELVEITNQTLGAATTDQASQSDRVLVNVVSYSEVAGQSFTMINGQLYREGEFVRAGLKVEKIEPDRVILNLRGRRIIRTP